MPILAKHHFLACLMPFILVGCSTEDPPSPPPPSETISSPKTDPPPTYTKKQIEDSLLKPSDIGEKWKREELRVAEFKKGRLRGCSLSGIELSGDPEKITREHGAPDNKLRGANYAQLIAIYPNHEQASKDFSEIKQKALDCPSKKNVPTKRFPDKSFLHPHKDTWKVTETEISGWKHIRGFEKAVYPSYVSIINVYYMPIDYALKGNVIFSSFYWQRVTPKDSGDPIAEKATELLTKQLNKFG